MMCKIVNFCCVLTYLLTYLLTLFFSRASNMIIWLSDYLIIWLSDYTLNRYMYNMYLQHIYNKSCLIFLEFYSRRWWDRDADLAARQEQLVSTVMNAEWRSFFDWISARPFSPPKMEGLIGFHLCVYRCATKRLIMVGWFPSLPKLQAGPFRAHLSVCGYGECSAHHRLVIYVNTRQRFQWFQWFMQHASTCDMWMWIKMEDH